MTPRLGQALRVLLERALIGPLRCMPPAGAQALGRFLGRHVAPRLAPGAVRNARRAFRELRPDLDPEAATRAFFAHICTTMCELPRFNHYVDSGRVELRGEAELQAALARGPVLLAGLHLANWEVIAAMLLRRGFPGAGLAERLDDYRTRMLERQRLATGVRVIWMDRLALREALRDLRERRQWLLFLMDDMKDGVIRNPSLGRAPRTEGNAVFAARLARLAGAAILPCHAERLGPGHYAVHILPPVDLPVPTGERDADLAADVAALDAALNPPVLRLLDQWLYTGNWRG